MIIGVDATNISRGGGKTHLVEYINGSILEKNIKLIVWAPLSTLESLPNHSRVVKKNNGFINSNILIRIFWHLFFFRFELRKNNCDVLFAPGGSLIIDYYPSVTMSRNMLPFDENAKSLLGWSLKRLKFELLKLVQINSMSKANGLIYLTNHAKEIIGNELKFNPGRLEVVIPHGVNKKFVKLNSKSRDRNDGRIVITYVSIIDFYKHHSEVVQAVSFIRENYAFDFELNLVGPHEAGPMKKLTKAISKYDPNSEWVHYLGEIAHDKLNLIYENTDFLLYASSCENLPNILLEMMASGRPCIVSDIPPNREILGSNGTYFNPYDPISIAEALIEMATLPLKNIERTVVRNQEIISNYKWELTVKKTINFLNKIANEK